MRGGEKVLEALIGLWPEADIHTLFYEPRAVSERIRERRVFVSPLQRLPGAGRRYRSLLPLFPWAVGRFRLAGYDLVVSISHCVAKSAAVGDPARHLCYCLTPMRYLWTHFGQYFGRGQAAWPQRLAMRALRRPLRRWDRSTSRRAGRYLAISRAVAQRIQTIYSRSAPVVHPPVDTDFFTPGPASESGYWLAASAMVPYKRLDLAVEACSRLGLALKVAGDGPLLAALMRGAGPSVEFLGRVGDARLRDLYRGCQALIFPGEEDFGIMPVEAQACGRPVVAYGRGGALDTVADGQTGAFFDEQSAESLMEALRRFDAKRFAPAACRANAECFRLDRFEQAFLAEAERFLAQGPDSME